MKKTLITMAVGIFLVAALSSAYAYESASGLTGVLKYDRAKAYNGYTLFSPTSGVGNKTSYLIDMEGYIVHEIQCEYVAGLHDVLLENGNILRGGAVDRAVTGCPIRFGGTGGIIQEIDWDGNVVWEQQESSPNHSQHHTFFRKPDGNTMILIWERQSKADVVAAGRDPSACYGVDDVLGNGQTAEANGRADLWPDMVKEYDANNNLVWEWRVWDHVSDGPDKAKWDINYYLHELPDDAIGMPVMKAADWTHFNTVGYCPETGMMIVNSRNLGEFYLIDRDGTTTATAAGPAGDPIYRWGNPSTYGVGDRPHFVNDGIQELFGPHCALHIPAGLPGAGNVLVLDNGWQRPEGNRTRSVEVDLSVPTDNPVDGIVWFYQSKKPSSLYSAYQCSNQRLPNNNTLITSTGEGHILEVTYDKEIVWEFINPLYGSGATPWAYDGMAGETNMVHRSHRYGPDHPGLAGKDLTPGPPITGVAAGHYKALEGKAGALLNP
jgi:hypothetical protein